MRLYRPGVAAVRLADDLQSDLHEQEVDLHPIVNNRNSSKVLRIGSKTVRHNDSCKNISMRNTSEIKVDTHVIWLQP